MLHSVLATFWLKHKWPLNWSFNFWRRLTIWPKLKYFHKLSSSRWYRSFRIFLKRRIRSLILSRKYLEGKWSTSSNGFNLSITRILTLKERWKQRNPKRLFPILSNFKTRGPSSLMTYFNQLKKRQISRNK